MCSCALPYGMPLEFLDIKLIVKSYLSKMGREVKKFKNNIPGDDWIYGFRKRNPSITVRMCQNIKRARVTPDEIREYFKNLEHALKDVPPENIINYDETKLADQPGTKSVCSIGG